MKTDEKLVAALLTAAGGEIVGRIRLQKILYLLDQKGLNAADAAFHYHHYGPYSRVLDEAIERAKALSGVNEIISYRHADGAPFSVFSGRNGGTGAKIGDLSFSEARRLIGVMKPHTSTVLELAATAHWLFAKERVKDWKAELIRRKGQKAREGRLEMALSLLCELGISPQST